MVQFLNEFVLYCREIGLLGEEESFKDDSEDLSNRLFMHLLTLNRLSLVQLANRVTDNFLKKEAPVLQERNSHSNIASTLKSSPTLYDQFLQKQENKILKQEQFAHEQLKDCTFQPQISKKSHFLEMNAPVHERLSKFGSDKRIKHQISMEIKAKNELKACTFRPQVNQSATLGGDPFDRLYNNAITQRMKPAKVEEEHYSHQPQLISAPVHPTEYLSVPVEERLYNKFLDHQQNLLQKQEEVYEKEVRECTFTPQINSANSRNDSRVFDRLYNHSNTKSASSFREIQNPQINRKSEKIVKNPSSNNSQYVSQFLVDQSPYERLYGEHVRIARKKKLKETQELSKITFRPQTNRK